ncbi:MAG: DMT family transporter, partial [Cyanobacteria bacterium J06623_1]
MMKYTSIGVSYAFCWGFGITISKVALSEISATTLLIIQLISSLLFLLTICYCKNGEFPLSRKSWQQGIAGIFEPALAYMAGTIGLSLTTATNASLIGSTEVVLTILCAAVILKEKLTHHLDQRISIRNAPVIVPSCSLHLKWRSEKFSKRKIVKS